MSQNYLWWKFSIGKLGRSMVYILFAYFFANIHKWSNDVAWTADSINHSLSLSHSPVQTGIHSLPFCWRMYLVFRGVQYYLRVWFRVFFLVGNTMAPMKSFCRICGSRVFPLNHLKRCRNQINLANEFLGKSSTKYEVMFDLFNCRFIWNGIIPEQCGAACFMAGET